MIASVISKQIYNLARCVHPTTHLAELLGTTCTPMETTTSFSCPTPTVMPCPEISCSPPSTVNAGSPPPQCPSSSGEVALTLEKLLVLVVPTAVGTILIVAVIAAVGVVICIKYWKKGKYQRYIKEQKEELIEL